MIKEYEGKSEKDAIAKAIKDLGLNQEEFDVEILESVQGGLFKKGSVKIKVHIDDNSYNNNVERVSQEPQSEAEVQAKDFLTILISKMGYAGEIDILESEEEGKIILDIRTPDSSILIGKKGRNLDALQLLLNVFVNSKYPEYENRFILDVENYRSRREDYLIRIAEKSAAYVKKTKSSKLLEPMNPFERRLIHTTLNDRSDVFTKSEGDGLYKRVRVIFRDSL